MGLKRASIKLEVLHKEFAAAAECGGAGENEPEDAGTGACAVVQQRPDLGV